MTRLSPVEIHVAANLATSALDALPTRRGQVAFLRDILGWSYAEIADELGISEGTARAHAAQARAALRDVVATNVDSSALQAEYWDACAEARPERLSVRYERRNRIGRTAAVLAMSMVLAGVLAGPLLLSWSPTLSVLAMVVVTISVIILWRRHHRGW